MQDPRTPAKDFRKVNPRIAVCLLGSIAAIEISSAAATAAEAGEPITVGHRYNLESTVLKETRTYFVHTPRRYEFTTDSYPVIILLDGDAHLQHTSATVDFLASNQRTPQMIVVAVANTDRVRDMTPPLAPGSPRSATEGSPGGAHDFLSFIADELLPHIDRNYRTRPYRILIGHSYGGLFATYALLNRPEVFNAYLMISPALWWDKQSLVKSTEGFLASHRDLRADLYVTLAAESGPMLGGYWRFSAALAEARLPNLRWQFHRWPDETHESVALRSTYEGLQAIFDGWYIHDPPAIYDQVGLAGIERRYAEVSARMGYEVRIPDVVFGWLQWSLQQAKRTADLQAVLEKGVALYPESPDVHLALGRLYATMNDEARAVEHLTKALRLFPGNRQTRAALEEHRVDIAGIVPEGKPAVKTLATYVGEYRRTTETTLVTLQVGKLYSTSLAGRDGKCELRAMSESQFYCVDSDVELTFNQDKSGGVSGVTVQQPGYAYEAVRVR